MHQNGRENPYLSSGSLKYSKITKEGLEKSKMHGMASINVGEHYNFYEPLYNYIVFK